MRLIDADALRKDLFVAITTQKSWMDSAKKSDSGTLFQLAQQAYFTLLECKQHLEKAPTIYDAPAAQPEIIRCKECKHSEHWYKDKRRCFLWAEDGIDVFDDGYCNYAEGKEE